jgi:hypothetical protein
MFERRVRVLGAARDPTVRQLVNDESKDFNWNITPTAIETGHPEPPEIERGTRFVEKVCTFNWGEPEFCEHPC